MRIGILTFHWATNYGAILQTYALQNYLMSLGNEVSIINYKPAHYDFSWKKMFINPRNVLRLGSIVIRNTKEQLLDKFRQRFLIMTERYYTIEEVQGHLDSFDVLISGSDQVLNPYYTLYGEHKPTSTYYLNFPNYHSKKIGYSLSFGCTVYPDEAVSVARQWINSFDVASVREDTGCNIIASMGYKKKVKVTPDPAILWGRNLFDKIDIVAPKINTSYVCVYMLRHTFKHKIKDAVYIDEMHKAYSMEEWLGLISNSKLLVTNSYHGVIMALLFHVPFIVQLEASEASGMNDRFYTLLSRVGLVSRIVNENFDDLYDNIDIDWEYVDSRLEDFRREGEEYLNIAL